MNFMKNLQRKFARFGGIPNLMIYITGAILAVYLLPLFTGNNLAPYIDLNRSAIFSGQIWRLVTFVFVPEGRLNAISMLIYLYFLYWVGNSLEEYWSSGSFTFYYLCGMAGAIVAAMITGYGSASYLHLSLYLAFAYLFPDMQVLLMFILPIKVKYLGYVSWALYALSFIAADWPGRVALIASLINFFLFFGNDFIGWVKDQMRYGKQRRQWRRTMNQTRNPNYWQR